MAVPDVLLSGRPRRDRARGAAKPPSRRPAATGPTSPDEDPTSRSATQCVGERPRHRWYTPATVAMNKTDLDRAALPAHGPPRFPARRHRQGARPRRRGEPERVQVFQGVVIRRQGGGLREPSRSARSRSASASSARSPCTRPRSRSSSSFTRARPSGQALLPARPHGKKARIKERRRRSCRDGRDRSPRCPRSRRERTPRRRPAGLGRNGGRGHAGRPDSRDPRARRT